MESFWYLKPDLYSFGEQRVLGTRWNFDGFWEGSQILSTWSVGGIRVVWWPTGNRYTTVGDRYQVSDIR